MIALYLRFNYEVCFVWPTLAYGKNSDKKWFVELAWIFWAIGLGDDSDSY